MSTRLVCRVGMTRNFVGRNNVFSVRGDENDAYYNQLPEHDLSALVSYLTRIAAVRPLKLCIDVGATIGLSALALLDTFPEANVVAFEPGNRAFEYLKVNIELNGFAPVIFPQNLGLGERDGIAGFVENERALSSSHLAADDEGVPVRLMTLDRFLSANSMRDVHFIKIDVEGSELEVLAGARRTIFTYRPIVLIKYNPYAIRRVGSTPPEFLSRAASVLGSLGVVDPQTGLAELLPEDGHAAFELLSARSPTQFSVLDLVNAGV